MIELIFFIPPLLLIFFLISLKKLYNLSGKIQQKDQEILFITREYENKIKKIQDELRVNKDFNISLIEKEMSKKEHNIASLKKEKYYLQQKVDKIEDIYKKYTGLEEELYLFYNNLDDNKYEGEEWLITNLKQKAERIDINLLHHYNSDNKKILARYLCLYENYQTLKQLLFKYFELK